MTFCGDNLISKSLKKLSKVESFFSQNKTFELTTPKALKNIQKNVCNGVLF